MLVNILIKSQIDNSVYLCKIVSEENLTAADKPESVRYNFCRKKPKIKLWTGFPETTDIPKWRRIFPTPPIRSFLTLPEPCPQIVFGLLSAAES